MTEEHKKLIAKIVRELYFYPYRSKGENIFRLITWMVSWLVGIVVQQNAERRALGGAYLIYSISLLLEFVPEKRINFIPKLVHGFFCMFLILIFLGAILMIFGTSDTGNLQESYRLLENGLYSLGWSAFVMMLIGIPLVLIETHKFFYDEEAEQQRENEFKREMDRKRFSEHLEGSLKGENT